MNKEFKKGLHVALMYVSWYEFVLGTPCTDFLGTDDPEIKNEKNLLKFAELLKTKNINDIKPEHMWKKERNLT
jgi:hypothetical protein